MKNAKGFSLVELLIATALSLVVLGGVMYLVVESQRSRATLSCMESVQYNGRVALDLIAKDVSAAGYHGCGSTLSADFKFHFGLNLSGLTAAQRDQMTYNLAMSVPISGFGAMQDATTPNTPPAPMLANALGSQFDNGAGVINLTYAAHAPADLKAKQAVYETNFASFFDTPPGWTSPGDLLTIRYVGSRSWGLADPMVTAAEDVYVTAASGDAPVVGDILYIGDCAKGTMFVVTAVTGPAPSPVNAVSAYRLAHSTAGVAGIGNLTADLGGGEAFMSEATIIASVDTVHYGLGVSEYPITLNGASVQVPSLYRARFISNAQDLFNLTPPYVLPAEEVVPGVVDLGVLFGTSDALEESPNRIRRISDIDENHFLHTADLSVQTTAYEDCGQGDDDDSTGWNTFTMRFERLLHVRNVRGAADS